MQKQQINALMEMSELVKLIKSAHTQRVKFDEVVQKAAVQCIGQSIVHRNIDPAKQLFDSVGTHLKRTLVAYFELFGNIALAGKGAKRELVFFDVAKVTGKPALAWTEEYAEKVASFHWTKAVKEPEPKSIYDADDVLSKAFKQLDKLAADTGITLKNADLYRKVKAAYAAAVAELVTKEIDATTHTAPTTKHEASMQRVLNETGNNRDPQPVNDAKLQQLKEHFTPAVAAA